MNDPDEATFVEWYGRWTSTTPAEVAVLLAGSGVRWWIAGGRAARLGAPPREHGDTDVVVPLDDLGRLREHLGDRHFWEAHSGTLRPLLPGTALRRGRRQLWMRRDAAHPWELDILLDPAGAEWVFKKDATVRVAWERALHTVDGVRYLRPEIALLHKVHLDRPKDRADLAAAVLPAPSREWLVGTLDRLGHRAWARAAEG